MAYSVFAFPSVVSSASGLYTTSCTSMPSSEPVPLARSSTSPPRLPRNPPTLGPSCSAGTGGPLMGGELRGSFFRASAMMPNSHLPDRQVQVPLPRRRVLPQLLSHGRLPHPERVLLA